MTNLEKTFISMKGNTEITFFIIKKIDIVIVRENVILLINDNDLRLVNFQV